MGSSTQAIIFQKGSVVHSTAFENKRLIRAQPGHMTQCKVYNDGADQYIQFHDKATTVTNGDVPLFSFKLASGGTRDVYDFQCVNGLSVCNSSTGATLTLGSADCWFYAESL